MLYAFLTIPEGGIADILEFVENTFDSVNPIFLLIVGVFLAIIILEFVVSLFSKEE